MVKNKCSYCKKEYEAKTNRSKYCSFSCMNKKYHNTSGQRGEIHIDHIIPLSSAKNKEEACNLCHFSNLQPLWALENLKKGAKIS